MRHRLAALAAAVVLAGGLSAAMPAAHATTTTYKIDAYHQNFGQGSYVKDQGGGAVYKLNDNAAISSNFTRVDCGTRSGVYTCAYKDGTGFCLNQRESDNRVTAENCVFNNDQFWTGPVNGNGIMLSLHAFLTDTATLTGSSGNSVYCTTDVIPLEQEWKLV